MTVGEETIALIERYGIKVAFGIPGVHTLTLYRGLAASGIRTVLTRHEQGAAFMADGYARATGCEALCCLITGPGLLNAGTGIGQAYSDSSPLLVVASVNRTSTLGRGFGDLHELQDQLGVAAALHGSAASVRAADEVEAALHAAVYSMRGGRARPAYLEIPIDVLDQEAPGAPWQAREAPTEPPLDPAMLARVAELLAASARPVVIVGGGSIDSAPAVRALAARLGAPVLTTVAGKGVVADSDPLCAGAMLARPAVHPFLAERDLALVLGSELAETDHYSDGLPLPDVTIRVDIDPARFVDAHGASLAILSDVGAFSEALLDRLTSEPVAGGAEDALALRQGVLAAESELGLIHRGVLDELRAALPLETRVFSDMTQIAYTGNDAFPVEGPRRWFHPCGFGTLGFALPAAMGALIGDPGTPTAALIGDAGILFTIAELATAVELELPLVILLWNNDALGQIRDDMLQQGIPVTSVEPRNPDYEGLAVAFGAGFERPRSLGAVGPAVGRALAAGRPVVVELRHELLAG